MRNRAADQPERIAGVLPATPGRTGRGKNCVEVAEPNVNFRVGDKECLDRASQGRISVPDGREALIATRA
jgi:hypothetical protein